MFNDLKKKILSLNFPQLISKEPQKSQVKNLLIAVHQEKSKRKL